MTLDLSALRLSPETSALLPLRASYAPLEELRRFGTWWLAPFARVGLDLLAVRLVPGRRLVDGPVVWAAGSATVTVASSAAYAVPVVVLAQILATPHRWLEARELLPREWGELVAAHRALGGADELDALRGLVHDEALRVACASPGASRDAAAALMFARVDPAPATGAFRAAALPRTSHADADGDGASAPPAPLVASVPPEPPSPFDPWAAAGAALDFGAEPRSRSRAWRLFSAPAGLDLAWADAAVPLPDPDPAQAARRLHEAARLLAASPHPVPEVWRADPLWPALLALAAAPGPAAYHGVEMMQAAAQLAEAGQPERALHALSHVQFWNSFTGAEPMDGALEAASALARQQGWAALTAMTEAVQGAARAS